MNKCILAIVAVLLAGCSEHLVTDNLATEEMTETGNAISCQAAEFNSLVEKARWGDGQAFLRLADCYREGVGVKKDFLGMMCMAVQSARHGGIDDEKNYFNAIPDDDEYRKCFYLMDKSSRQLREGQDSILRELDAIDNPDVLTLRGVVTVESGDAVEGMEIIRKAAEGGSSFAELLLALPDWKGSERPDADKLLQIAEKIPVAYKILGRMCLEPDENGYRNEEQAAYYYLKAEEKAMLGRLDALWLLSYHKDGGNIQLTEEDVRRLEAFSRLPEDDTVVADTLYIDNEIQE